MDRLLVSLHPFHRNKQFAFTGTVIGRTATGPERLDDGYATEPVSLDRLLSHIQHGGAWVACQLLAHPQGQAGWRHADAAGPSNLIVLDVDGDLPLSDFWAIPFVQRHCLFTSTTCSHQTTDAKHPEPQDRYRAVFPCEDLTPELHPFVYRELLGRLDLTLKDNSGEKPERLWYGNDQTIIRQGDGQPLSYELIEDARDAMSRPRPQLQAKPVDDEYDMDCKRICYLLLHLLPVSCDNEYEPYWQPMMSAAIAANSDEVWEAFLDWNKRGHHYKKNNDRRCERERSKGSRSHMGKIMKFARERLGADWHKLLPPELQYQRSFPDAGLKLYTASHARGDLPDRIGSSAVANTVASTTSLYLYQAKAAKRDNTSTESPGNGGPVKANPVLIALLEQLYQAVVHNRRTADDGSLESIPNSQDAEALIVEIRAAITEINSLLAREGWRIDRHLFNRFLDEFGFPSYTADARRVRTLAEPPSKPDDYIIPNLIARGRCYLLYGKQGTGKTTLALSLARAALGFPGHDQFLDFPAPPIDRWRSMRVLYIATDGLADAYTDIWNYAQRQNMGQQEWAREYLHVLAMDSTSLASPWRMELPDLRRLIDLLQTAQDEGLGYGLVIIDSLKAVCPTGVYVKDPIILEYVNAVYAICSRYNAASLFLHHQSKEGDTAQGVAGLPEQVSGVFRIKNDPEKGRFFVVEKTRAELDRREIPYVLSGTSLLSVEDDDDNDDGDSGQISDVERRKRAVIDALTANFTEWRMLNSHLDPCAYAVEYCGVSKDFLYAKLSNLFSSKRTLARTVTDLCKEGKISTTGTTVNRCYRIPLPPLPTLPGLDDIPGF